LTTTFSTLASSNDLRNAAELSTPLRDRP
jgi:hypothetical protein